MMQYATHLAQTHYVPDSTFIDPNYYNPMTDVSARPMMMPGGLQIQMPSDYSEPLVHGSIDHFGHTVDPAATTFSPVFSEPTFQDSPDAFNSFFGLDDSFSTYHNNYDHHALLDFGKQFDTGIEPADAFQSTVRKLGAYSSSTSVSALTQSSRDDSSSGFKTSCDEPVPMLSSRCNSTDPSSISTASAPLYAPQNSIKEEAVFEVEPESTPAMIPHQLFGLDRSSDLPLRPAAEPKAKPAQTANKLQQPANPPRPVPAQQQAPSIPQQEQDDSTMEQYTDIDAATLLPTENGRMDSAPSDATALKSPSTGLAARRRQRPPFLSATKRSSSYSNNAVTANPLSPPRQPEADSQLRRIKSSGVLNGRISKSGTSSGQRSPLGPNFQEGSMAPMIRRQMSLQSLDAVARDQYIPGQDSIPMTPMSPMDMVAPPGSQYPHGRPYSTIIESDMEPEGLMMANVSHPPTATPQQPQHNWMPNPQNGEPMQTYVSPPCTPMDYTMNREQFIQHSIPFSPAGPMQMPQSAPAWQPVFSAPPPQMANVQYTMAPVYSQPMQFVPVPMQQQHQQPMGPPLQFFGNNGPQPVFRPQPMSHEEPNIAALFASQQQHSRRPSGPVLVSAQSMPQLSGSAHQQQQFLPHGYPVFTNMPQQPQQFSMQPVPFPNQQPGQQQQFFYTQMPPPNQGPLQDSPVPLYDHNSQMSPSGRSHGMMSTTTSPIIAGPGRPPSSNAGGNYSIASPGMGGMPNTTPTKPATPELLIHEYSPREPADPSRLPPKMRNTTPRTYSFQHTGPEAFSGSP